MRQVEHIDLKIDMDAVLATLPERNRRAVILFMEGMTQAEVGVIIGVRQQSVSRWIKNLRVKMANYSTKY